VLGWVQLRRCAGRARLRRGRGFSSASPTRLSRSESGKRVQGSRARRCRETPQSSSSAACELSDSALEQRRDIDQPLPRDADPQGGHRRRAAI